MDSDDFRAWVEQMSYTYDSGSAALDISRRMFANYINGGNEIPKSIALACAALAAGLSGYKKKTTE